MVSLLELTNGRYEIVMDIDDFLEIVDDMMGREARVWLSSYLDQTYMSDHEYEMVMEECEKEVKNVHEHYRNILKDLRELSEQLAVLIRAQHPDRRKISAVAGKIGMLTWRNS